MVGGSGEAWVGGGCVLGESAGVWGDLGESWEGSWKVLGGLGGVLGGALGGLWGVRKGL